MNKDGANYNAISMQNGKLNELDQPSRRVLLLGSFASFVTRLRHGEGVLLAINASIILYASAPLLTMGAQFLISILVLALLYSYNDLYDCHLDQKNPKKDQELVSLLIAHRPRFYRVLTLQAAITLLLSILFAGSTSIKAIVSVLLMNAIYSRYLKRIPVIDVIWIALVGAVYVAILEVPLDYRIYVLVGVMTGISHIYQVLGDQSVDRQNEVRTTAVFSPNVASALLLGFCAVLFLVLEHLFSLPIALTALLPYGLHLSMANPRRAWQLSKIYFAIIWLSLLLVSNTPLIVQTQ